MDLGPVIEGIADDLRKAASVGGEDTRRVADLLVAGSEAALRLRLIEALHAAAVELEASASQVSAGVSVDLRLEGRDPVLSIAAAALPAQAGDEGPALGGYADDELLRLTIRIPEGLKAHVEHAAAVTGASINSWIVSALARALEVPGTSRAQQPGRRMPRRVTGFVQG